jgi:pyrimidine-nucleoside phosphorylase
MPVICGSCVWRWAVRFLLAAGKAATQEAAVVLLERSLEDGSALEKLADMVEAQGGSREAVYHPELLPQAPVVIPVLSPADGYVTEIHAENVGLVCLHLAAAAQPRKV